jgi:hypothetical protein
VKADVLTLKALFQKDVRYVIPMFQRPYVWNQEDQWEPLWEDVRNTAERFLENLATAGPAGATQAEEKTTPHFLGAVVLQQQPTPTRDLDTRYVIDGQQRLTTLQLLLDAAQEVFERDGFDGEARQLRKLVLNDQDYAAADPDLVFKVSPTLTDRDAFRAAMHNDLPVDGYEDVPIVQAHQFFKVQITEWLSADVQRANALVTTLMGLLQLVVIDLSSDDDANVIFETLNARGTPLLASDLIKNAVLHAADQQGLRSDNVYRQYWRPFDDRWWRAEIRQGRIVRPRIDVYLNYWLTMRTAEEVQTSEVFPRFRQLAEEVGPPITGVLADLAQSSTAYRKLDGEGASPEVVRFLYRWRVMDAGVTTPVILWLFANESKFGADEVTATLAAIESFLVRRMLCRLTTKDYNKLFLELLTKLSAAASSPRHVAEQFLAVQVADARVWPSDNQLMETLRSLPVYQLLTRRRLRMVLEACEDALRSPKSEEAHVAQGRLTIEHIMPQAWRHGWPLDSGSESDAPSRDRLVHTIGNLTLLNGHLNPSVSNGSWEKKRKGIDAHSVLHLNKQILNLTQSRAWSDELIAERSRLLAALIASVWPRAKADGVSLA